MPTIWILSQEKSMYRSIHDACLWMRRPLGLHGGAAEEGTCEPHPTLLVTLVLPKDWPPASKASRSLPHVLHLTLVQKCDLHVWKLNVPLNFELTCHLYVWVQDGQIWLLSEMESKLWNLSSQQAQRMRVWLSCNITWGGSFAIDAQDGWGGRKGGFGMDFHLKHWANLILPLQFAHFRNQLSQWSFLLLFSN